MNLINKRTEVGHGLVLALIAGVALTPLSANSDERPAGVSAASSGAERIYLAQADADPVERPVSYASDQADRGRDRYQRECEECHGKDLRGGLNGGPPLRGSAFEQKFFEGAPASGLFHFTSTAMPPNAPGRYSADTYADLVAYILKQNGFQPGAPLPADLDALDYLIMEK